MITKDSKVRFLNSFVGMQGFVIVKHEENHGKIHGFYDCEEDENDEPQEFEWEFEEKTPDYLYDIAEQICSIIIKNNYIDSDIVTANEIIIKERFMNSYGENEHFESALDLIFNTEVRMIDNGIKSDFLFVHM